MLRHAVRFQLRAQDVMSALKERERGATAVEYGLLVALIAAVIVGVVVTLGTKVNAGFTKVDGKLPAA
ncbi:MAG TPA: Flp family type IVb pilin [Dermatophilaceae bacterium]|nr:Flp family type IVb pilin [Dermatophilaceae bacterium]